MSSKVNSRGESSPPSSSSHSVSSESRSEAVSREVRETGVLVSGGSLSEYEVLKAIGKGKFSVVYRAKRKADKRLVAVKKVAIVDIMDKKTRDKCLKEVKLLQSLEHPNIIQYLDAFLSGGDEWHSSSQAKGDNGGRVTNSAAGSNNQSDLIIVLEWAEAGDLKRQLRKAIQKRARFEERIIWRYFAQIASAIGYMHSKRIMHRDLKPANIFLMADGTIKVGDLGLSRSLSENTLQAHSKVGTPLYMSPEVLRGNGYDFKSDVWSLGCILYELAALKSPFKEQGLNLYGLFQKINKGTYPPVPQPYSKTLTLLVRDMLSVDVQGRAEVGRVVEVAQRMREETERAKQEQRRLQREQQEKASNAERTRAQDVDAQKVMHKEGKEEKNVNNRAEIQDRRNKPHHKVIEGKRNSHNHVERESEEHRSIINTNEKAPSKIRVAATEAGNAPTKAEALSNRREKYDHRTREPDSRPVNDERTQHDASPPAKPKSARRPISRERRLQRRNHDAQGDKPIRVPRPPNPEGDTHSPNMTKSEVKGHDDRPAPKEKVMSDRNHRDKVEKRNERQYQRRLKQAPKHGGPLAASGAIYLMDLALEKLNILDYHRKYIHDRNIMQCFTPVEFALPRASIHLTNGDMHKGEHAHSAMQQMQLSDFFGVCSWLLNSFLACDWREDDMQTALENTRSLLTTLTDELGLSPDAAAAMAAPTVAHGYGHSVCLLLNWILDKALMSLDMKTLSPPDYSKLNTVGKEEFLQGDSDIEDTIVEDETSNRYDEIGEAKTGSSKLQMKASSNDKGEEEEEYYRGGVRRGPDADITAPWDLDALFKISDVEAQKKWDIECERVRPKLHAVNRHIKASLVNGTSMNTSAWREHLQIARVHSRRLENVKQRDGNFTRERSVLERFFSQPNTMPWAQDLVKIKRQESGLERMYSSITKEWQETAKRLKELQKEVNERQISVNTSSQKYAEMSEDLADIRDHVQRIGENVSDTSPVQVSVRPKSLTVSLIPSLSHFLLGVLNVFIFLL